MSHNHALRIFRAALNAADPERAVLRYVKLDRNALIAGRRRYPLARFDRIQVVGAGKASAAMARAVERILGKRLSGGFVNVPRGSRIKTRRVELNESGHPIPDERGLSGAQRIAAIAAEATGRDLLICVISGGASALMPDPAPPITLADTQETTRQLLACGANIHELNAVRKHISVLKGGHVAKLAWPATVIALILSDVVGDDLDVIGSGPTVPDRSTFADARSIFDKYAIRPPRAVRERIQEAAQETPKPGDPTLARVQNLIVGSSRLAIDAAVKQARALGYRTLVLSTFIEGETRDVASMHAAIVKEILTSGRPVRPPACILSGGETTVTIRGQGLGGRNQEFVLAAAIALDGFGPFTIFSAGTDGADGPTDAAGAFANERCIAGARELDIDARQFLANNDSYHFFGHMHGLVKTGPSGTNVMDVRILLVPAVRL